MAGSCSRSSLAATRSASSKSIRWKNSALSRIGWVRRSRPENDFAMAASAGHDALSDSRTSHRTVLAGFMPAIHVFLIYQRLGEQLTALNFRLDAVGSHRYGGRIPIR